jgi:hypothetical protein
MARCMSMISSAAVRGTVTFDSGACFDHGGGPKIASDYLSVQFHRDASGFQLKSPNDVEQRGSGRERTAFSVNCNLFFSVHKSSWIIINFALYTG